MKLPKQNTPSSSSDTSWGKVADWYSEHLSGGDTYHETLILPNLLRLVGDVKGKQVLDLACGTGYFSHALAKVGANVTGVDIAPELIEKARLSAQGAKFAVSLAHDLSQFESASFDMIVNVLAIDNISEIGEMLRECARVLKRDGSMHIVFNHPVLRIPGGSSWDYDQKRGVQYRRLDKYMSEARVKIAMHPGLNSQSTTTFHRPLQYYFKLINTAGLCITNLEEWISSKSSQKGPRAKAEDISRKEFPLFLYIQAKKC
ncbi:MAG TPA: class I SAM-dependent methyltransferase [Candidatus Paceibacterota bacterium]